MILGDITMRNFMNTVAKELTAFKEGFKKGYNEAYKKQIHKRNMNEIEKLTGELLNGCKTR